MSAGPTVAVEGSAPSAARFSGRVALVTGAASGIGATTAHRLAREGARVAIFDRDIPRGRETAAAIAGQGGSSLFIPGDISVEADARSAVARIEEDWHKLDIVVHSAGQPPSDVVIEDLEADDWSETFKELTGCFYITKHAVRLMKKQDTRTRSIIFVASMAALKGVPLRHAYCAMKHGVLGLSRSLALELAPTGIRVNCIAVGPVDTPFLSRGVAELAPQRREHFTRGVPLGRIGTPDDISNIIAHLVSDESEWITGNVIRMAGGTPAG